MSTGVEYFIEIQQNTLKKMQPHFSCLLCDSTIKTKSKGDAVAVDIARGHLKSSAHKLKYLVSSSLSSCC